MREEKWFPPVYKTKKEWKTFGRTKVYITPTERENRKRRGQMKFDAQAKNAQGNVSFLRLKDKESVIVVLQGEPYIFYSKWENGKTKVVDPDDDSGHFRFRMNAVLKENNVLVSKILEQGWTVYALLKELHAEYDLSETYVKITRNGSGQQTTYSVLPILKQKPDMDKVLQVKLQSLSHTAKASRNNEPPMPTEDDMPSFDDEELPF